VDMVISVLDGLFKCRDAIMQQIYEITGISDIMRGVTEASETAAAQQLKSTWGSSRVREKQKELARVARDVMRIMGEIIAEKFGVDTLKRMTNVKLLTRAEKQQIEQWQAAVKQLEAQAQAMQQQMAAQAPPQQPPMPGQPPQQAAPPPQMPPMQPPPPPFPPEMMELMAQPSWEDVKELLENEAERMFRIDIEADSTVEMDMVQARKGATEYVTSMSTLISQALPAVQMAPPLGEYLGEVIKAVGRLYPFGRQFEEIIDRTMATIAKQPAPPSEEKEAPAQKGKSPQELLIEAEKVKTQSAAIEQKREAEFMAAQTAQVQSRDKVDIERMKLESSERIAAMEQRLEQMAAMLEANTRAREVGVDFAARRYEVDNTPKPTTNGAAK